MESGSLRTKWLKNEQNQPPEVTGAEFTNSHVTGTENSPVFLSQVCYLAQSQAFQENLQNCVPRRLKNSQNFWVGRMPLGYSRGSRCGERVLGKQCPAMCFGWFRVLLAVPP